MWILAMTPNPKAYWKANLRVIIECLSIWFAVAYLGGIVFVESLNSIQLFGYPFGFWLAHQGSIYVFTLLVFYYAWRMNRLDKQFGVEEQEE